MARHRIERGEIRLVRLSTPDKVRPAVVLTRDRSIPRLTAVSVAPITSTIRGVGSEVILDIDDGMKGPCSINLHNVTTVDATCLGPRVAKLGDRKLSEVCRAIEFALGCGREAPRDAQVIN